MRWTCCLFVIVLLWAGVACACLFTWTGPLLNTDGTKAHVLAYRLYRSTTPTGHVVGRAWEGETMHTFLVVPCLTDAYWVVTAFSNVGQESAPSHAVFVNVVPPSAPAGLRVNFGTGTKVTR